MVIAKGGAFTEADHVGPQVVDPDLFCAGFVLLLVFCGAFGEKEDVGFHTLGVEDAGGQSQNRVQCAFVHQIPADLGSYTGFEQHVIRQDNGGPASGFQAAVNMLKKGELLVAGGVGEVVAGGTAAAPGCAERRIGEDQVCTGQAFPRFPKGIAQMDNAFVFAFHAMKQTIHQGQTPGSGHEFHAHKGFSNLERPVFVVQIKQIIVLFFDVGVSGDEKPGGTCGGVLNNFTGFGFDAANNAVDQGTRGEILACAGFGFADVFL